MRSLLEPILITGATGFMGFNLLSRLIKKNYKPHITVRKTKNPKLSHINSRNYFLHKCDLKNNNQVIKMIEKLKPKTVFHMATYGSNSYENDKDLIKETILNGGINLLNSCIKENCEYFINTGSSSEYGFKDFAMSEKDVLEPNSYYAVYKAAFSNYCSYEKYRSNKKIITIRPFHIYGPYEDNRRLIPTLINNFIEGKQSKLVNKNIARDCVFVDDAVDFFIKIASRKKLRYSVYNLGSGHQSSIEEIYGQIQKSFDRKIPAKWGSMNDRIWDQSVWLASTDRVVNELNWKPKIPLKIGIKKTVLWTKKQRKTI